MCCNEPRNMLQSVRLPLTVKQTLATAIRPRSSWVVHRTTWVVHRSSWVVHRTTWVVHRSSWVATWVAHRSSWVDVHRGWCWCSCWTWKLSAGLCWRWAGASGKRTPSRKSRFEKSVLPDGSPTPRFSSKGSDFYTFSKFSKDKEGFLVEAQKFI